jgi:hypothetical protein
MQPTPGLYESDTAQWAATNAQLLRERRFADVDVEHLIEELDDMGKSERRALDSHIAVLLMHLLKWQFQPGLRSRSWEQSIANARADVEDCLFESPSLRSRLQDTAAMARVFARARRQAAAETGLDLDAFPQVLPYSEHELLQSWMPK